ncbi:hypothetical protein NCDO763_2515 [Lactococcus cremoris]|uniref:ORF12 n=1 Tax=Lactococcus lactis subsp. cremoris (strain MG1363) TaxID=416870 RepID=A2RL17_LACLM|nr:ORF12 [Lactococcus cremoris subsp. cremoris MG1363]KZK48793.1 hypothetical protein NCDO763_2515 [Lactococcus cremoris]CAL97983.1 hypothetical protein llmg_1397 [Lactococcus cremoris subsp. cremoris MG1363]
MKINIYRVLFLITLLISIICFSFGKSMVPTACYFLLFGSIFQVLIVEEKLDK